MSKFSLALVLPLAVVSVSLSAQNNILFQQMQDNQGSMVATTSTTAVKMYSADDFVVNTNSKINKITLEGVQLQGNLSTILNNVDIVIVEAPDLTGTPFNGNIIYQAMGTMAGVTITGSGINKNFEIDLTAQNVQVETGKKYWLAFTANSNLASSTTMTDWYWYPVPNTSGTSISKKYYNGTWSNNAAGLTFKIEGVNSLGTIEIASNVKGLLKNSTVSNEITVMMDGFSELEIMDQSGKKVLHSKQVTTNVEHLTAGIYYAILKDKKGNSKSVKFIKK